MGGALVVIGSAKGSPGVTTLAVSLAACWPTAERQPRPLLVEADPAGADLTARFGLPDAPGLMTLAAAARRTASPQVLAECVQMLRGGVHLVAGPAGSRQAAAAVRLFAAKGAALLRSGMGSSGSVLVDVGRLQTETGVLVEQADRVLLVTRGNVDALSHVAATAQDLITSGSGRVELVLVGASPYAPAEIASVLGVGRVHRVPWDPKTARSLCGGAGVPARRWRSAPLVRASTDLAWHLAAPLESQDEMPGRGHGDTLAAPVGALAGGEAQ